MAKKNWILIFLSLLLLVATLPMAVYLVRQRQEIRKKAVYPCTSVNGCGPGAGCGECQRCQASLYCENDSGCPCDSCMKTGFTCQVVRGEGQPDCGGWCEQNYNVQCHCGSNGHCYADWWCRPHCGGEYPFSSQPDGQYESCTFGCTNCENAITCYKEITITPTPTPTSPPPTPPPGPSPTPTPTSTPTPTPKPTSTPTPTPRPTSTPTSTPTPPPVYSCECKQIKVYNIDWKLIPDFSTIQPGQTVRFAVLGWTDHPDGITQARIRINGGAWQYTTDKKPGTEEYYIEYTIPISGGDFVIEAEIYNPVLGWK